MSVNEWIHNFDSKEGFIGKHLSEVEKEVRDMSAPSSDIHKNTTFAPDIINKETDFLPNVACSSFHPQVVNDCEESSCLLYSNGETELLPNVAYSSFPSQDVKDCEASNRQLHLSGYSENFEVSYSNNLRNSTPKSSVVSHSNNLQRTPEIVSYVNHSHNLQSSTPKASTLLSPFESDLTEVKFEGKNFEGGAQHTAVKNCEGLKSNISNNIYDFQFDKNSFLNFKHSNYEDCVDSSMKCLKFNCLSTENRSPISTYFSGKELQTPPSNVQLPMLIDKAFKAPNESPTNSVNEHSITENVVKRSSAPNACKRQESFLIQHNSEVIRPDEESKMCNSESLFKSFNIQGSDLISFEDALKSKPNGSYNKINLIDFSSDLECKLPSSSCEISRSINEFTTRESLIKDNRHDETIYDIMHDILNQLSPKTSDICSPHHYAENKETFPDTDESNVSTEVFGITYNTENLAEKSDILSIKNETLNLNQFASENLFYPLEINGETIQYKRNSKNDNLVNDLNCKKNFCVTDNTENMAEDSEYTSIKSETPNLKRFDSKNVFDPLEINEETTQGKYNSENVNLVNDFNCRNVFCVINNTENLAEHSEATSIKSETPNLNLFDSKNVFDPLEINKETSQPKRNFEIVDLEKDFNSRKVFCVTDNSENMAEDLEATSIKSEFLNLNLFDSKNALDPREINEETSQFIRNSENFDSENDFDCRKVLCVTDNMADDSEVPYIKSEIPNLNQFASENFFGPLEINKETTQGKLNFENVSLKNNFNSLSIFNDNRNNITECHRTFNLEGKSSGTIKSEENTVSGNSFPDVIREDLTDLTRGTLSSTLDIDSVMAKFKRHPTELLFENFKSESTTNKEYCENSDIAMSSSHVPKLPLKRWKPFKMGLQDDSKLFCYNFKTLIEKDIHNTDLFNIHVCKAQESMLNFGDFNKLRLFRNRNSISSVPTSFSQPIIISEPKLTDNKSNELNSNYGIYQQIKRADSEFKPQDSLSKNSVISLKSDKSLHFANIQNYMFKQNETSIGICGLNTNSKLHDVHLRSKETKALEYLESNKDRCLENKTFFNPKDFQNVSNPVTFAPIHEEFLTSRSNRFLDSRFSEDISKNSKNFPSTFTRDTSINSNPNYQADSSESFETDSSMDTNSDSEILMENYMETKVHETKLLPLQELFDIDKRVAKAVIQTFTDLGSSRGLKQSQIVKHINQRKMLKTHSKFNRDIQNFLKVACEVGIMKSKRFRYFLSEGTSYLSKKRKESKNKYQASDKRAELNMKYLASARFKTRTAALEMITPNKFKTRRSVFKVKTPASTKTKGKRVTLEMETPTRIKTRRAVFKGKTPASTGIKTGDTFEMVTPTRIRTRRNRFKVETSASARIKQNKKALPTLSNAKCQFLEDKTKSPICHAAEIEVGSPMVFKTLRSRVILKKKNA